MVQKFMKVINASRTNYQRWRALKENLNINYHTSEISFLAPEFHLWCKTMTDTNHIEGQ
jgi:hypothetical protein